MNWQDYFAIGFFATATCYVAWRVWRALFGSAKAGCGSGCGSCGSTGGTRQVDLLAIGPKERESKS
jgi:hypothetical protein